MQKLSLVLNFILLAAVAFLFVKEYGKKDSQEMSETESQSENTSNYEGRIAFVNIDSLDMNYQYIIDEYDRLEKESIRNQRKLENRLMSAEGEYQQLQKEAPYMTMVQAEEAQKRLESLAAEIQNLERRMANDLRDSQANANATYRKNLMAFLEQYNEDKNYDYILGLSSIGSILWAKDTFDITEPVLDHLNTEYAKLIEAEASEE